MFGNKEYITEEQLSDALSPLLKRIDAMEKGKNAIEEQIKALKADNSSLKSRLSDLESLMKETPNGGLQHTNPNPSWGWSQSRTVDEKTGTLYLPSPTPSGTFTEASEEVEIGKSIYMLQTDDGSHGTFELLQTPDALATAMISVSQFLKPVCRITGNIHSMPDKVETVEKGNAQKKDGVWTVTKKTVVKFI